MSRNGKTLPESKVLRNKALPRPCKTLPWLGKTLRRPGKALRMPGASGLYAITLGLITLALPASAQTAQTAQTVSQTEQASCAAHHVERWCGLLALDFHRQQMVVEPLGDVRALGADMAPRALRMTIEAQAKSALKTAAEQAGERALQTISVSGAVNQTSGTAATSGSTDLAGKPTTTDFLSVAEATGGFTETQNGSALTVQADALGMTKYLRDQPIFARVNGRVADWLQPLTLTATVNLAQSEAAGVPVTLPSTLPTTGSAVESIVLPSTSATLNAIGASYQVYRRYSPQDKKFAAAWRAALTSNQTALATAGSAVARAVNAVVARVASGTGRTQFEQAAQQWAKAGAAAERAGDFAAFAAAYERYRDAVADLLLAAGGGEAVNGMNLALEAEQEATLKVLDEARGKPLATLGYLYTTPTGAPATHSFTLALAQVLHGGAQVTGNFAAEIYASVPTAASYGRLRDVQMAMELDSPVGGTAANPRATVSAAGYGQYQYDPAVLNVSAANVAPGTSIPVSGQVLAGQAGWLGVAQGKLTLHLRPGMDLPLAIKWSNRTELLPGSDVRGQFGLSFDLSALSRLVSSAK